MDEPLGVAKRPRVKRSYNHPNRCHWPPTCQHQIVRQVGAEPLNCGVSSSAYIPLEEARCSQPEQLDEAPVSCRSPGALSGSCRHGQGIRGFLVGI